MDRIYPSSIAVIDPAQHTPELACFNQISQMTALRTTYHVPALHGFDTLCEDPKEYCGVVILGSGASVYDEHPWQLVLHRWIEKAMTAGIPTLGICYGHQAIAHIQGGQVGLLYSGVKKKGVRSVQFGCDRLKISEQSGTMVVSHREGVTSLPADFEIIGRSQACTTDAIRHVSRPIWGVQPHIEAVHQFCINNQIALENNSENFRFGHVILSAFLSFVRDQVSVNTGPSRGEAEW